MICFKVFLIMLMVGLECAASNPDSDDEFPIIRRRTQSARRILDSDVEDSDHDDAHVRKAMRRGSRAHDAQDECESESDNFSVFNDNDHSGAMARPNYLEKLVELVKSNSYSNRADLHAAMGLHEASVIDCFKRALRLNRLTPEEIRPFYISDEDKQLRREGLILRIKARADRTDIFAFYNTLCRKGRELTHGHFNQILKQFHDEGEITEEDSAFFRYKQRPVGYRVDTTQLIVDFVTHYSSAFAPTSSWKELYEKFSESEYYPEVPITNTTFAGKLRKLMDSTSVLSAVHKQFISACKDERQSHVDPEGTVRRRVRRAPTVKPGEFKKSDPDGALKAFVEEVKHNECTDRQELIDATGYAPATVNGFFYQARQKGLLSEDEIVRFNTIQQKAFRLDIANLVRDRQSEEEILAFCQQHENAREKTDHYLSRNYLRGILQYLYQEGVLTTQDTAYLKLDGTVVNRRGGTKGYIIQFFETRASGFPTNTRAELAQEFNVFTDQEFSMRSIDTKTFVKHVHELIEQERLTPEQIAFFELCKDPKQR